VEVVTWRQPRRLSATTVPEEPGYDATPSKSDSDDDFHFDASDDISSAAMMNQVAKVRDFRPRNKSYDERDYDMDEWEDASQLSDTGSDIEARSGNRKHARPRSAKGGKGSNSGRGFLTCCFSSGGVDVDSGGGGGVGTGVDVGLKMCSQHGLQGLPKIRVRQHGLQGLPKVRVRRMPSINARVATRGEGDFIGLSPLLTEEPATRHASVRALTQTRCCIVSKKRLMEGLEGKPELLEELRLEASRRESELLMGMAQLKVGIFNAPSPKNPSPHASDRSFQSRVSFQRASFDLRHPPGVSNALEHCYCGVDKRQAPSTPGPSRMLRGFSLAERRLSAPESSDKTGMHLYSLGSLRGSLPRLSREN